MRLFIGWLALVLGLTAAVEAQGQLVIVGGGLSDDNDAVFEAFLGALPAPDAPIAIIPAASATPAQSAAAFAAQLEKRGVARERIRIIRLATEDDPATSEDESAWAGNGDDDAEIMRLARVGGIWFTGGDQARIVQTLLRPEGGDTGVLSLIRTRFAAGAVIGGTSAGAAIMGYRMIRQGDPYSLVPGAGEGREALEVGPGLGFLKQGLVDQHFGERARLIRLVAALERISGYDPIGFGIDEDTALVIAPDQRRARVVGRGRVTVVDARDAAYFREPPLDVRRAALVSLSHGELLDLPRVRRLGSAPPVSSEEPLPDCLAAPSGAGLPGSESNLLSDLAARLRDHQSTTCLMAAGSKALALRFSRQPGVGEGRLLLDILPVTTRIELRQR